ncbi:hypothetical protein EWM64_g1290 [Hericium alpestre]|uniref:Uncharacterized protein n=1 Tax=Hericium alpestre TaxID=135208 RepID=A0A4Z0A8S6_9AGAM|nr:hypothetical protein EWM64_g1290 [Hericium alpestre]
MVENGLTMTPRISDENWPILWAHLLDARSPSLPQQQLPVCGRVEFDIDLTKARWWDTWLTSTRRGVDAPFSVAPSVSHLRADSKTTFMDDQAEDANSEASFMPARPPAPRHVPRKLSLVDRLDSISLGSALGLKGDDAPEPRMRNVLTPIRQEEEAKPANLGDRVRSWRASSSAAPTPMAAVGQLSLDPVNMPNTVTLESPDDSAVAEGGELNLEDFKWTASSKGPPEYYEDDSPVSSPRVQSVHLDRRAEGSVLLTPSTATTWGPWGQNDDLISVSPMSNVIRLPSPDLGQRMLDDVHLTPSTATSWGPPLDWPPSPLLFSRPPSVDLGERMEFSRPVTPSTATSWGPPTSWPPTPAGYHDWDAPRSPDIGERAQWSEPPSPRHNLVFPYFRPEVSACDHVWPFTSAHQGPAADSRQTAGALGMRSFSFCLHSVLS